MMYADEMSPGVTTYIPSFEKIGLGFKQLMGGGGDHRQR
jgi:hypothetical protein